MIDWFGFENAVVAWLFGSRDGISPARESDVDEANSSDTSHVRASC